MERLAARPYYSGRGARMGKAVISFSCRVRSPATVRRIPASRHSDDYSRMRVTRRRGMYAGSHSPAIGNSEIRGRKSCGFAGSTYCARKYRGRSLVYSREYSFPGNVPHRVLNKFDPIITIHIFPFNISTICRALMRIF